MLFQYSIMLRLFRHCINRRSRVASLIKSISIDLGHILPVVILLTSLNAGLGSYEYHFQSLY